MTAMAGLVKRLRAEVAVTREVRQAAERWSELSDEYDRHPCHSPERREVGEEIARCLLVIAAGVERSRLAGAVGFACPPDILRADAESWRNGDAQGEDVCPHGLN